MIQLVGTEKETIKKYHATMNPMIMMDNRRERVV